MTTEHAAQALFLVLAVTLPLSALVARRLPHGRVLRLALIWLAIFVVVAVIAGALPLHARSVLHNIYYQTGPETT